MNLTREDLEAIAALMDTKMDAKFKDELSPMQQQIASLGEGFVSLQQQITSLRDELSPLKATALRTENELIPMVKAMYDGYQAMREKLEDVEDLEPVKERVSDLEFAVKEHTRQIKEIKEAM